MTNKMVLEPQVIEKIQNILKLQIAFKDSQWDLADRESIKFYTELGAMIFSKIAHDGHMIEGGLDSSGIDRKLCHTCGLWIV